MKRMVGDELLDGISKLRWRVIETWTSTERSKKGRATRLPMMRIELMGPARLRYTVPQAHRGLRRIS